MNQTHRLTITDTSENGEGFARLDRMAVFVPGLVTGDTADVILTESRKNYAVGQCAALISPSEHRISPACPSFGRCGGCSLCHVSYEFENTVKQNCVKSALRRMKLPYDLVEPTRFTPARTGYRNKIGLHYDKSAHAFGYMARDSHDILPFDSCLLCGDVFSSIVRFTNDHIGLLDRLVPDELFLRRSHDGRITVSVYTGPEHADLAPFRDALKNTFPEVSDVLCVRGDTGGADAAVTEEYMGVTMRFASEVFRQVNHDAAEILMELVCTFAEEQPFSYAADLYCGSGAFGLVMAKRFPHARFFGLEIDRDAIRAAKANADANGLANISFVCADAATFDGRIPAGDGTSYPPELVVVDPPRAGLSDRMREGLVKLAPERLAYVSCNPQTMARDLAELVRGGYRLLRVTPVNMFPMTKHVECVVCLSREKADDYVRISVHTKDLKTKAN
ncbi:MAG: class I SAM-dependent RNA methyltransferase [Clostridia bacterium]|nr:class I SAM-dependent RNA methyltransferase [Clostridia bacterium]